MARRTPLVPALLVVAALTACGGGKGRSAPDATTTSRVGPAASTSGGSTTSTTRPAPGDTPCQLEGASLDPKSAVGRELALLRSLAVTPDGCRDTVTFGVDPAVTGGVGFGASYESPPFVTEGEGRTVTVAGTAFIVVKLRPADIVDVNTGSFTPTYTGPNQLQPTGTNHVRDVRTLGSFEGQSTWVIGLDAQRPFTVRSEPARLVLTIG